MNILLVPWPLDVKPKDFRTVHHERWPLKNMDSQRFGFFSFAPDVGDVGRVAELVVESSKRVGDVDLVVLPELALTENELRALEKAVDAVADRLSYRPALLSGVRERGEPDQESEDVNQLELSYWSVDRWIRLQQTKHHRWCLDGGQIRDYHLGAALDPSKRWWEAFAIKERQLNLAALEPWLVLCPLICEDLARQEPVARLVRAIGPSLVIALLLDGPQLKHRWPARYATVLADDPGSSVLTLTSLGMALRSCPPGKSPSPTIGLWKDPRTGPIELQLQGADGLLLSLSAEREKEWTADGRSHTGVRLVLGGVEPISLKRPASKARMKP